MKVVVTGGAGYIGTLLCRRLAAKHEVVCWDPGFFGYHFDEERADVRIVRRRVQAMTLEDLDSLQPDWVLHLSGLSNDPMADFAPAMNWAENLEATRHVGELTKKRGIPLIFASSASVYGFNDSGPLSEQAPVAPIGYYSKSKAAAETWLQNNHPHVLVFRQATVKGVSPRMRFDLLTNGMTKTAWLRGRLRVLYGGRERRPQVHVDDLVRAYELALESSGLSPGLYNISSSNDSVMELAESIRDQLTKWSGCQVELEVTDEPRAHRSYELSAAKFRAATGWQPRMSVSDTVAELWHALEDGSVRPEDVRGYNIEWMKILYEAQGILERVGPIDTSQKTRPPLRAVAYE